MFTSIFFCRSMLSIGSNLLSDEVSDDLIAGLFSDAGLADKCALTLEDFKHLFSDKQLFNNISIDWKGKLLTGLEKNPIK